MDAASDLKPPRCGTTSEVAANGGGTDFGLLFRFGTAAEAGSNEFEMEGFSYSWQLDGRLQRLTVLLPGFKKVAFVLGPTFGGFAALLQGEGKTVALVSVERRELLRFGSECLVVKIAVFAFEAFERRGLSQTLLLGGGFGLRRGFLGLLLFLFSLAFWRSARAALTFS
jgi:hypothetical protein